MKYAKRPLTRRPDCSVVSPRSALLWLARKIWPATAIAVFASTACSTVEAAGFGQTFSFGDELAPGVGVVGLASADLDGDGIEELIGCEPAANRVVIWEPDGSGGIRVRTEIPCPSANGLAISDFDGNGIKDIAVTSQAQTCVGCVQNSAGLTIFSGFGAGSYPVTRAFGVQGKSPTCGDLNGDGHTDLVLYDDSLFVLISDGFALREPASYPLTSSVAGLAVGDTDHDGFDDVILVGLDDTRIYAGGDKGALVLVATLSFGMWEAGNPALADFDGDGGPDLVLPVYPGGFNVFWNSGDGLSAMPHQVPGRNVFCNRIAAADLDGDGRLDLLASSSSGHAGHVVIEWNAGVRLWEPSSWLVDEQTFTYLSASAIVPYDYDQDGRPDIVLGQQFSYQSSGQLVGLRHVGDRSFAGLQEIAFPHPVLAAWPTILDDGRAAILVFAAESTIVVVARPDGSFEPIIAHIEVAGAYRLDWDGDGARDLAIPRGEQVEIQLAGGGRELVPRFPFEGFRGRGDFNGDGLVDVLLGASGPDMLIAFRDPVLGYLAPTPLPAGSDFPQEDAPVAVGDFDGDGLCDLAEGAFEAESIDYVLRVYVNAGNGRFVRNSILMIPRAFPADWGFARPSQLVAVDVDRDGRLDIVYCAQTNSADVFVWVGRNVGDGRIQLDAVAARQPAEQARVAVLDVTNDGLPDLIGLAFNDAYGMGRFSFRPNVGGARFGEPDLRHVVGLYPNWLSFGDLNGDMRLDVVTSSNGGYPHQIGVVRILLNIGQDFPVAVAVSPLEAVFLGSHARVRWSSPSRATFSATVMRSENASAWREVGTAWSDGTGLVTFDDATVHSGHRYSYRLEYMSDGVAQRTATIELFVPGATLSLALSNGNPAHGRLRISCSLPDAEPATLDLFDIAGRRVETRAISRLPSGAATVELNAATRLAAGVYWARLTQGARAVGTRIVLLP